MDDQTKRKMIRNYFKKTPEWAIALIVIGAPIFLVGLAVGEVGAIVVGILPIAIGAYGIYSGRGAKPTDRQMDEWLEEDLKSLNKKALDKMGTDESELVGEPVEITGPRFWDIGDAKIHYKRGNDKIIRFTPLEISVINFTQNQLLAYSCVYDFTTGKALNEGTSEYFYKDVVSVATKSESRSVSFGSGKGAKTIQLDVGETFVLTTSGGTSISLLLRDPKLIKEMAGRKGGEIPTTRAEKAIQTVRKMLREKKA
ncbi:hypothetical protein M1N81_01325 [Dehalococcoidia bacterium]|nr:hypothetical protein [Dehalococcoidia bacterium]